MAPRLRRRRHHLRDQEEPAALLLGRQPPRPARRRHRQAAHPSRVIAKDKKWTAVNAGWFNTCGITAQTKLYCWGDNAAGQIGDGGKAKVRTKPTLVKRGKNWASVSVGSRFVCGTKKNGALFCWGGNLFGQLGLGSYAGQHQAHPRRAPPTAGPRSPPRGPTPAPATPAAGSSAGAATPSARSATAPSPPPRPRRRCPASRPSTSRPSRAPPARSTTAPACSAGATTPTA